LITRQASQAVMGCGFDENLQQGASYYQRCKYFAMLRVIAENFAAKLPPSPQLTVLEYSSLVRSHSQSSMNIKSSSNPTKINKPIPYLKHDYWKKKEHFSDADIQ
jgi:hypothetical protein